jgi:hypothetical protein
MERTRTLRQLVEASMYVIDPERTAAAILLRRQARLTMPALEFRNDHRASRVRSFRLASDVPSFRLSGFVRRGHPHRGTEVARREVGSR